jgi:hypothetical protein
MRKALTVRGWLFAAFVVVVTGSSMQTDYRNRHRQAFARHRLPVFTKRLGSAASERAQRIRYSPAIAPVARDPR